MVGELRGVRASRFISVGSGLFNVRAKLLLRFRQSQQAFHTSRCQNAAPRTVSAAPAEIDRQINDDDIQRPNFDRATMAVDKLHFAI
jgi:hypothetical protein